MASSDAASRISPPVRTQPGVIPVCPWAPSLRISILDDEDDLGLPGDQAPIFHYDEADLASEESMWALYERWCSFFKVARDHDEMRRRFDRFKTVARDIYEFNKSGESYTKGLNHRSDMLRHEIFYRRQAPRPPSTGGHVFYNEKGEITAFLTDGILKEINPPAPRILKPIKMIKPPET